MCEYVLGSVRLGLLLYALRVALVAWMVSSFHNSGRLANSDKCTCVFWRTCIDDGGQYVESGASRPVSLYHVISLMFLKLSPYDDVYKHIPRP